MDQIRDLSRFLHFRAAYLRIVTDFLIDGRCSTIRGILLGGWKKIVNILQSSHHVFIKFSLCTSISVIVLSMVNFDISNALGQN